MHPPIGRDNTIVRESRKMKVPAICHEIDQIPQIQEPHAFGLHGATEMDTEFTLWNFIYKALCTRAGLTMSDQFDETDSTCWRK